MEGKIEIKKEDKIVEKIDEKKYLPAQENFYYSKKVIEKIRNQATKGGMLLSSMGSDIIQPIYWDKIILDACQVTNPPIDPLREPMELRTFLGRKPTTLDQELPPQLTLETPILFSAMSFGAISINSHLALAEAAKALGTFSNIGEGGLPKQLFSYSKNIIVQVASGRFGVTSKYLDIAAAIEIKIGQGAKPGIGGHLPGEKVSREISETRMIPEGSDAISPAPHHDIYSIEDLKQLIFALKEATSYKKPIIVKIAAVNNAASIASGITRAGADIIEIDGFRGGTGATPSIIRDNTGIPIELALARIDEQLRTEGIRNEVSLIVSGGIRNSADIVKAIALGADAVSIGTSALIAIGCIMCRRCHTGKCPAGICTQNPSLVKLLDIDLSASRLVNLIRSWDLEIKEVLGSMGINAIESLRGNRERLRGVDLNDTELKILGIKHAGL